jgi:hypothetical protein
MRLSRSDRWLLTAAIVCLLLAMAPGLLPAVLAAPAPLPKCDDACREVTQWINKNDFEGTRCLWAEQTDCTPCYQERCRKTGTPGAGTCIRLDEAQTLWFGEGCSQVCPLVTVNNRANAEATGGMKDLDTELELWRWRCQPAKVEPKP